MTKHIRSQIVLGSVLTVALIALAPAKANAQACVANASPTSNCYNGLLVSSPNLKITISNEVYVSGVSDGPPPYNGITIQAINTTLINNGVVDAQQGNGINNQATNATLINNGGIYGGYDFGVYNPSGSSFALIDNRGGIGGIAVSVDNDGGTITKYINSGYEKPALIPSSNSPFGNILNENSGYIGTLINNGTIAGKYENNAGIDNEGRSTIALLINDGIISNGRNGGPGIINNGGSTITIITNFGTITSDVSYGRDAILNNGSIVVLNNLQGVGNAVGSFILTGNLPTNYNVIIASPQLYGQLNGSNSSGVMHFGIYNGSIVTQGIYSSVLSNVASNDLDATSGTYSLFNWTLQQVGASEVWDLALTFSQEGLAAEQQSVQGLSESQRDTLIEGRSTANELLGFTRPVEDGNHAFAGGMFGSAIGYAGGQVSSRGVTLLGGIAYGSQDYGDAAAANDATTIALAARYMFDDFFGDENHTLHPYAEVGGWVTPSSTLAMSRTYTIGGASDVGTGNTKATDWDYYLRLGVTTDLDHDNKLTGFGEIGEQAMDFGSYTESAAANNPTPATVNGGELSMGVLRAGGAWTHKLGDLPVGEGDLAHSVPIAITLSGAVAHSFATHAGLTMNAGGVGFNAAGATDMWGEYGARIEGHVIENTTIGIDMLGTAGGGKLGNSTHAGIFLGYEF